MATIFIEPNEAYRTRIEDVTNKECFFYPAYIQARNCLDGILENTREYWEAREKIHGEDQIYRGKKDSDEGALPYNPMRHLGYPNNIVAFCADRGQGKTSAMLSFSRALERLSQATVEKGRDLGEDFWPTHMYGKTFMPLDSIDPTVMDNSESIIPTVISRMFNKFENHVRKCRNGPGGGGYYSSGYNSQFNSQMLRETQQNLLQQFQKCYRLSTESLRGQYAVNEGYDDLQLLADRSASSNFKSCFNELVREYLKFLSIDPVSLISSDSRKAFLVIQIDDADMNPKDAYSVVEDLRKYCVLPNVVILFATNLEQLELSVEQHFLTSFHTILNAKVEGDVASAHTTLFARRQCHQTAVSYLDKLIPGRHRINLPNINNILRTYSDEVQISFPDFSAPVSNEKRPRRTGLYQNILTDLLKDKCLLDLVPGKPELHAFLPRKMRELTHFMSRVTTMKTVNCSRRDLLMWASGVQGAEDCTKDAENLLQNLDALMDYFIHDWCELNLTFWQRSALYDTHLATPDKKKQMALYSTLKYYNRDKQDADKLKPYYRKKDHPAPETETMLSCSSTQLGKESLSDSEVEYAYLDCLAQLEGKNERNYVFALEFYFRLYKEYLMAADCSKHAKELRKT